MDEILESRIREIVTLHYEIGDHLKLSLEKAIRIGQLLCEQKRSLEHGEFIPWVKDNLPFTERTAQRYMKLYNKRHMLKNDTVSHLSKAYRLLVAPKTADILDYFVNEFTKDFSVRLKELPKEKRIRIYELLVFLWICMIKEPEVVRRWMKKAQENLGPDVNITNQWHEGKVTCFCSKCNGRVIDVSPTVNRIVMN